MTDVAAELGTVESAQAGQPAPVSAKQLVAMPVECAHQRSSS
ncbi:hypothetical protein [Streptomyces sp. SID13726]|nr:hypothetical protein [Streptomyces sp. SID13726]